MLVVDGWDNTIIIMKDEIMNPQPLEDAAGNEDELEENDINIPTTNHTQYQSRRARERELTLDCC